MKNQNGLLTILSPCLFLIFASCSAHLDGGSAPSVAPFEPKPAFERAAIAGPDVIGDWQSSCVADPFTSGTRQATLSFTSKTEFKYSNLSYGDSACQQLVKTDSQAGIYQFSEKLSSVLFAIDYNYMNGKTTYYMNNQRLEFATDTIYISEFTFGDVQVNRDLPFKKVTAGSAPIPSGPVTASQCEKYSGTYQMNMDYFKLEQSDCTKIIWDYLPTYDDPTELRLEYLTDQQSHMVNGHAITAGFNDQGLFTMAYVSSDGTKRLNVYGFEKTPCNLSNPNGSDYLTRNVYVDGVVDSDLCMFWAKN